MFKYLKFTLFYLLGILTIAAILMGQHWITVGYACITAFTILGDLIFGDDNTTPEYQHLFLLRVQLWFALPLLATLVLVAMWSIAATDILGLGQMLGQWVDYDFNLAKTNTSAWQHTIGLLYVSLMVSMIGLVTAHELIHRTCDKVSLMIGRWLLAFSFDSNFSIEHVYGHHRYVATEDDPATAPRGRNVYQHIFISSYQGYLSAWNIEKGRLVRRHQFLYSFNNTFIRGVLMSWALVVCCYWLAGWLGVTYFCLMALFSKAILEVVNYMEHYGLVRDKSTPVAPRHSWNTNKKISSWSMFNLSRHSHHHAQGHIPFHQLRPYEDAPMMLNGYLGTISLTLIPPLWFKLMKPKLQHWDQVYATKKELALLNKYEY
jgi:hypothetical protein